MTEAELAELDLAVARIESISAAIFDKPVLCWKIDEQGKFIGLYQPTRDGAEAMRLLEKYRLGLNFYAEGNWECYFPHAIGNAEYVVGPTPAIAICRAVVALRAAQRGKA